MSHKINDIFDRILNASEHQLLSIKPVVNELVYQLCDIAGIEFHPTFFQDEHTTETPCGKAVSMITVA